MVRLNRIWCIKHCHVLEIFTPQHNLSMGRFLDVVSCNIKPSIQNRSVPFQCYGIVSGSFLKKCEEKMISFIYLYHFPKQYWVTAHTHGISYALSPYLPGFVLDVTRVVA